MVYNLFDDEKQSDDGESVAAPEENAITLPFEPPSTSETVRRSGLAWSAGIVFFGSTAFMLGLGWLADLIFGTKPWGLVGGIVFGAIIGFVQFFRITSQIYRPADTSKELHPLFNEPNDDNS